MTDDQIRALATLGDRVESHYGSPQDIEWAIDGGGTLWLTQARPITTLFPLPVKAPPPGSDLRVYFCFSVAQGLYRPFTPMGLAAFRLLASSMSGIIGYPVVNPLAGPTLYAEAGERLFIDVTPILRSRVGRALMPRVLDVMEARSAVVLRQLSSDERLSLTPSSAWSLARRVVGILARFAVPVTAIRALLHPSAAHRHAEGVGRKLAERSTLPETATSAERLDFAERILSNECIPLMPRTLPGAAVGFALLLVARKLLGQDADGSELSTVLRGLPHNVTTEMDLALWALASRVRTDAASSQTLREGSSEELAERFRARSLPAVVQAGLADFLDRYGHRAVAEIDVGMPRWSDDPQHVLGVLANYLRFDETAEAPDALFARRAAEAEAMIQTLTSRARRRGRVRACLVRFALARARALVGLRETPKFYLVQALAAARRQISRVGEELASRGRLDRVDDVYFVELTEARAGLSGRDLRGIVDERRARYEQELRRRHLPRVLLSDGTEPEAQMAATEAPDGSLSGTPASAGHVKGKARVILDPVGAHLEPGEILVAPSTDPGWTPLFLIASGLVMEMGGANSHGAVVAREYGIPAVVGVPGATVRITTGQEIEVDGTAGRITVV